VSPVTLVGGIGLPWLRDLDFGTQWINRQLTQSWPDGVILEDLSYGAHRVLHTIQDLQPTRIVLVCCMPRQIDPAGTIRRYRLDLTPPPSDEVVDRLSEAVMGIVDLDHTLAVVRHFNGFPADTVVVEVEPEDRQFGLGFSDTIEATVDRVAAMVRFEVDRAVGVSTDAPMITPPTSPMPLPSPMPNMSLFPSKPTEY
jgi:hydrogenase maturation protease